VENKTILNNSVIQFGSIIESGFQELLSQQYANSKKVIIVDENTHDHCLEYLLTTFDELTDAEVMLLPAGEENKVLEVCSQVWEALTEYEIGRKDLVINLGGGVVTDMGGFIAAVFKRGIDFIHIPTSLLGMVDAAIGGKTGIDLGPFKNQLGVFSQPIAVFIDPVFLGTLPENQLWNGFAEVLKHALIADPELWNDIKRIRSAEELKKIDLIRRAARVKMAIVDRDELETGERKLLNFGHTVGHALEGFFISREEYIGHGHVVAIGMIIEARLSSQLSGLSSVELSEIEETLGIYPMVQLESEVDIEMIISLMRNDKKNETGEIKGITLERIGTAKYNITYDEALLKDLMIKAFL
jgi:3-dehydroquinate synthase